MATPNGSVHSYSVPAESTKVFQEGMLKNPLIAKSLPTGFESYGEKVKFVGSDFPSVPINWRFAESISALKGLEAVFLNALLVKKYGVAPVDIVIDTDHAQLFFMSTLLWRIEIEGEEALSPASFGNEIGKTRYNNLFKDCDLYRAHIGLHRNSATNIYKTRDGPFFHIHGSMNPDPTLDSLNLPHESEVSTLDEAISPFVEAVGKLDSEEIQKLEIDKYRQAGTICWTKEEYANSEHGKANAHIGLWETYYRPNSSQNASWWPSTPATSPARPLAGLKIVDLTRIIAAPAVTRGLAEMGASVMRITASHLPDINQLQSDLNWGKWCASLDLREAEDRETLKSLILDADVVISGYRPGIMEKYGFGPEDILKLCAGRERGIIVARENCYGWHGPWAARSGWQQISDACCGVSMEFGRAMGNDEPVTPVFPNSDYCTGVAGLCGVLDAILQRGEKGGSYQVDIALNYYSQWLVNSVGTYPPAVWDELWSQNGRKVFRHYHNMLSLLPPYMGMLFQKSAAKLFKPSYFESRPAKALNEKATFKTVKPILTFPGGEVKLGFNVSTRGNEVDQPRWPKDLMTEVVG